MADNKSLTYEGLMEQIQNLTPTQKKMTVTFYLDDATAVSRLSLPLLIANENIVADDGREIEEGTPYLVVEG